MEAKTTTKGSFFLPKVVVGTKTPFPPICGTYHPKLPLFYVAPRAVSSKGKFVFRIKNLFLKIKTLNFLSRFLTKKSVSEHQSEEADIGKD